MGDRVTEATSPCHPDAVFHHRRVSRAGAVYEHEYGRIMKKIWWYANVFMESRVKMGTTESFHTEQGLNGYNPYSLPKTRLARWTGDKGWAGTRTNAGSRAGGEERGREL